MPTIENTKLLYTNSYHSANKIYETYRKSWSRSPRVNGKLALRPLYYHYKTVRPYMINIRNDEQWYWNAPQITGGIAFVPILERRAIEAQVYSRFRGKLYQGNAALGVTAASYRQSRDMILDRVRVLDEKQRRAERRLQRASRKQKAEIYAKELANTHLEVIFGWTPLIADVWAATNTVIQLADHTTFVRAAGRTEFNSTSYGSGLRYKRQSVGFYRRSMAAGVKITNQNSWLLERAGLLNPASVAWDLVPWSFVVNMFVNTGALVNSVTDFVGLTFQAATTTEQTRYTDIIQTRANALSPYENTVTSQMFEQERRLEGPSRPPLVFRLPGVNWETAAMAASLFTQRFHRFSKIFDNLKNQ